ncbi:MAG TPA: FecR domain-containing protein [Opitutaceae bacterium]|nr:FecR domain-containing protein [Opitutaceae bacterium]
MNPLHPPPDPAVEEEAALWAARLDGSVLSAADRTALDQWLAGDPARRAALSLYCQFSADLEQLLPTVTGMREQAAEIPQALVGARPTPWLRRSLWIGAALTAAAALALVYLRPGAATAPESVATAVAQRRQLVLPDGTAVHLNAQSALVVDFSPDERRVRLASGQAFFTVTRDAARPFTVETPAGSVRVTGTAFDIRTEAGAVLEVTVAEGSVAVRPPDSRSDAPVALRAGDRFTWGPAGPSTRSLSAGELQEALAWRGGHVVFRGAPLREVMACFARYHGRDIAVAPDVAELRLGGRFALDDLDGFFAAVQGAVPVRVVRSAEGDTSVVSR